MPGLIRKLLICAAVDGLLLQPVGQRGSAPASGGIKITYKTNAVSASLDGDENQAKLEGLEAHGIVGLLKLSSSSYLISISRREEVAQIRGKPVYVITDVALIPLSSQQDAEKAINAAQHALIGGKNVDAGGIVDSDVEDDDGQSINEEDHEDSPVTPPPEIASLEPPPSDPLKKSTTFVQNVIQDKGKYGRFAKHWFSKGGWTPSGRKGLGVAADEGSLTQEQKKQAEDALPASESAEDPKTGSDSLNEASEAEQKDAAEEEDQPSPKSGSVMDSLTPRIVRSTRLFFSSSSFFYSYDYDVSRSLATQDPATSTLPLFKRFDPLYFWNRNLISPFIEAGQHSFVLPLIQGFVGQRSFTIAETDGSESDTVVEADGGSSDMAKALKRASTELAKERKAVEKHDLSLTLISRRSVKRAGLRYLRRGIDDEGNVANNVESEQILSTQDWDPARKIFSLVQVRGSIPLFFSQSPYSFKPLPTLFGSEATNQSAFKQHFTNMTGKYGNVQIASLVDKHATEAQIGASFEEHAKLLNDSGGISGKAIGFEWFDFHSACKGMKFENVSILMETLRPALSSYGWTIQENDMLSRTQSGVLRTNCMDCLDRTNVVQSAVAGNALQKQLAELGLNIDLQTDPTTSWFNTLWADNGDAISKEYAGTAALKGDFTRTRKRNWTGALSDFSLTLNRYYNNIFGDYFLQTCIDYYLGNAGPKVFEDFETDMMTQDYALDMRRIRQNAIDTCVKIVLEDPKEDLVGGWTLSCPHEANTLRSLPFEECVLLLTDAALYFSRFDWSTEKVGSFERIDLLDISELWHGTYITSVLGPANMDEAKNVGFAMRYKTGGEAMVRTNTRSMNNEEAAPDEHEKAGETAEASKTDSRLLAFKALPPKSSAAKGESDEASPMTEEELVLHICEEIHKNAVAAVAKDVGAANEGGTRDGSLRVQEKDVLSVAEAKKSTGYLETIGYSLKKLVWS